ncbi:hypothetical protein [Paracoccus luteus]|uniref:hypothetical protein n=1 Tax=Paracoccus luteus TaxID=2508543 RepID=UPI00106FA274|nr:hypothetical protein [Paracoccus luteus]
MSMSDGPVIGAPIDRSQETYRPSPYPPQKTLPHGDVSPDGSRAWPEPSMTSRVLVYGGAAVAAAAVTAGAVLAVRKVADMVSGNDEIHDDAERAAERARERVYGAARRDGPTEREREAMRARARSRMQHDDDSHRFGPRGDGGQHRRTDRPRPSRPPRTSMSFISEIEDTAQRLSGNLNSIIAAVGGAMNAFRAVAENAEGVVRDFSGTADQIRSFLNTGADQAPRPQGGQQAGGFQRPRKSDVVDLRDGGIAGAETRTHRL